MNILFCGLGSIGQRHLRNLHALRGGLDALIAYRSGHAQPVLTDAMQPREDDARLESLYNIQMESDLDAAFAHAPQVVFITNPSALHIPLALRAARAGCHLFIEKPLSHTLDDVDALLAALTQSGKLGMVGYQLRFNLALKQVKRWLEADAIGPVVSASAHWGEYLPGWHPWEDYTTSYAARHDLGGGPLLTLSHPLDYLYWLLGPVESVSAATGQRGGLGISAEDTALVTLHFASGALGAAHLSYVQRPPRHDLTLIGPRGSITWDAASHLATLHHADGTQTAVQTAQAQSRNDMFLAELDYFFECIEHRREPHPNLVDGIRVLRIALAAHESAAKGQRIKL